MKTLSTTDIVRKANMHYANAKRLGRNARTQMDKFDAYAMKAHYVTEHDGMEPGLKTVGQYACPCCGARTVAWPPDREVELLENPSPLETGGMLPVCVVTMRCEECDLVWDAHYTLVFEVNVIDWAEAEGRITKEEALQKKWDAEDVKAAKHHHKGGQG
jgi:hypothetical protein